MDTHQPARGNVLIVDDDNDVRDALTAMLEDEGYQVAGAANGLDALNYLRATLPPCLILLDLMMPVMDGWLFRTTQMQDPALASIPVVVLSAFSNVPCLVANLNVADCIQKPVELETLLTTVERYCG